MKKQDGNVSRRAFIIVGSGAAAALAFHLRYGIKPVEAKAGNPKAVDIVEFSNLGQRENTVSLSVIIKTDAEWKQQLSPAAYEITRQAGTERPYSSQYWNLHDKGLYRCICAIRRFLAPTQNMTRELDGPAFGSPSPKKMFVKVSMYLLAWSVPQFRAQAAMLILGMFSMTGRSRRACVIA